MQASLTPHTLFSVQIKLSDEKLLYYRKVYGIFDLLEDFGGILGTFQMLLIPFATYSSILMTNFILNTHFVHEDKHAQSLVLGSQATHLNHLKPFGYTFLRYICSKCAKNKADKRFMKLREKGESYLEETLNVETLLR